MKEREEAAIQMPSNAMISFFNNDKRLKTSNDELTKVVEPDTSIVEKAWHYDTSLIDCIHYQEKEGHSWGSIADDFILKKGKRRIAEFIKIMHTAKIETERKMRL